MADAARHGDHPVTATFEPRAKHSGTPVSRELLAQPAEKSVLDAEHAAILGRREAIRNRPQQPTDGGARQRDRSHCDLTGLALSGGGIRSASFGLGALQGLHVAVGIEGIDYLSTVSGGGYVGSALTCCMQHTKGAFPFTDPRTYADTDAVRHIRDFSNYLIPRGGSDIITAGGIILRGLVANAIIVLPLILALVWITLVSHPTIAMLNQPMIWSWNLKDQLAIPGLPKDPLWGLNGFWFTIIVLVVDLVFLFIWVMAKSISTSQFWQAVAPTLREKGSSPELQGRLARISKILFFVTVLVAWIELQPYVLYQNLQPAPEGSCARLLSLQNFGHCFSTALHEWIVRITPWLAPIGAIIAFFAKYLGDVAASVKRSAGWRAWSKKIVATAAIWLAAIIIPSLLWLLYFVLVIIGIRYAPDIPAAGILHRLANLLPWDGETVVARLYFEAFVIIFALSLLVNPNVTSLYRLYRDRLSKAFLFDPDSGKRDSYGDLLAADPKLHQLDTDLCPYPIINAALNIEGSQYANKRGRNADFFMFTPEYTGSDATNYVGTKLMEHEETALDLGTAMAISAAAVSSNMGSATIKPLTLTLALLNIRLGYWLRNPHWIIGKRSRFKRLFEFRSIWLWKEMFGFITERSSLIYLTDGGNIENLGVYSLLKRRCPVIVAVDAEADPTLSFRSFLTLERYARIDLGVTIDLPWQAIRDRTLAVDRAFEQPSEIGDGEENGMPTAPGPHCAAGVIDYGPDYKKGILFYVKASLTGDESDYVLDYKKRNPDFPHETTGDQFFGEEQLEAYRALGFHIMNKVLEGQATFAVVPNEGESEDQARKRILAELHAAFGRATQPLGKQSVE